MAMNTQYDYHIAQILARENFGEFGKMNAIQQYFTQPNSRSTGVVNVSYFKFANIFLAKTPFAKV